VAVGLAGGACGDVEEALVLLVRLVQHSGQPGNMLAGSHARVPGRPGVFTQGCPPVRVVGRQLTFTGRLPLVFLSVSWT